MNSCLLSFGSSSSPSAQTVSTMKLTLQRVTSICSGTSSSLPSSMPPILPAHEKAPPFLTGRIRLADESRTHFITHTRRPRLTDEMGPHHLQPDMRYRLRTLLILLAVGPPLIWSAWLLR